MARLPRLNEDELSSEQKQVFDRIKSGPRGKVEGPLRVWLYSPELAERAQALGAFCRYSTKLEPRLSELAIAIMGAHWRAAYEWQAHAPIGIAAGLSPDVLEAIRTGATPEFVKADEAALYAFATELLATREVSPATFATAKRLFGDRGVVDLVGILGYYSLISLTIKAFEVDGIPGAADPFGKDGGSVR
jgi:4-carboxymuconolactone decarboxylase